jgi:hypothetical protein
MGALFSSNCAAIDVIRARDIQGYAAKAAYPFKDCFGRVFDVA